MKIGIIGVGMVGGAMLQCFTEAGVKAVAYDKYRPGFTDEDVHFDAFLDCDTVFVCVPTPTVESGLQDISALDEVLKRLSLLKFNGIVCSKCTTLPGTTRRLAAHYSLKMVHYPEFLTAAKAYEDFKFQPAALLSGREEHTLIVGEFLRDVFPRLSIRLFLKQAATEVAKYAHNCFLATKVSFFNEFYDVCDIYQVSYQEMIDGVCLMEKVGESHTRVPGPDGKRGFGGACFPKDTKAFYHYMKHQIPCLDTLKGAIESNNKRRKAE